LAAGAAPGQAFDPTRFDFVGQFAYRPPSSPGDLPSTQKYNLTRTTIDGARRMGTDGRRSPWARAGNRGTIDAAHVVGERVPNQPFVARGREGRCVKLGP
jgi:hypothetical protein